MTILILICIIQKKMIYLCIIFLKMRLLNFQINIPTLKDILIILLINIIIATLIGLVFIRTYCNLNINYNNVYCVKY